MAFSQVPHLASGQRQSVAWPAHRPWQRLPQSQSQPANSFSFDFCHSGGGYNQGWFRRSDVIEQSSAAQASERIEHVPKAAEAGRCREFTMLLGRDRVLKSAADSGSNAEAPSPTHDNSHILS